MPSLSAAVVYFDFMLKLLEWGAKVGYFSTNATLLQLKIVASTHLINR